MFLILRIIPIPLLALFIFSLIWRLNVSSLSRCIPKYLWVNICWTLELLNIRGRWYTLFIFREKITPWGCFNGPGLKNIFHLLAQRLTLSRSLFSFCEVLIGSQTTKTIEVSSAKSKQWTNNWTLRHTSFDCQPFTFLSTQNNFVLSFELKRFDQS